MLQNGNLILSQYDNKMIIYLLLKSLFYKWRECAAYLFTLIFNTLHSWHMLITESSGFLFCSKQTNKQIKDKIE